MSNCLKSDLRLVSEIAEEMPGISADAPKRRNKDNAMSSSEVRRFFEMYRSITRQDGLDVCKSVPLEIVLTLLSSGQMVMHDEEILTAVDAPEANIARWMKVLVERDIVTETDHQSGKVYSLSSRCLSEYLVEI